MPLEIVTEHVLFLPSHKFTIAPSFSPLRQGCRLKPDRIFFKVWWHQPLFFVYFLFFFIQYIHSYIHSPRVHSCFLIALRSVEGLPGVPSRDSNSGLPYSRACRTLGPAVRSGLPYTRTCRTLGPGVQLGFFYIKNPEPWCLRSLLSICRDSVSVHVNEQDSDQVYVDLMGSLGFRRFAKCSNTPKNRL